MVSLLTSKNRRSRYAHNSPRRKSNKPFSGLITKVHSSSVLFSFNCFFLNIAQMYNFSGLSCRKGKACLNPYIPTISYWLLLNALSPRSFRFKPEFFIVTIYPGKENFGTLFNDDVSGSGYSIFLYS